VYDGLCTFEFGVAFEVFGLTRPEMGHGWYRFAACAIEPGPLRAAGGLTVTAEHSLDALQEADIIIIPGWRGIASEVPPDLVTALQSARTKGARIMSLCSGIVVLAESGFLEGKRATTHWKYFDQVSARFPRVNLNKDDLYVDEGNILTAAGSAAAIDLCLHVVRTDFGAQAANKVAKRLVVPPHREGGQAQFVYAPVPVQRRGAQISAVLDWMRQNLDQKLAVPMLAAKAGMSIRTFQRRFDQSTGLSPGEWLLRERIKHAQFLLETQPDTSLSDIAATSGFNNLASLRHHFQFKLQISPSAYRKSFRC
jgi:AraC family transcriptional activator FtrA